MIEDARQVEKKVRGKHKKGRLIIRNLSFKITEDILKEEFSKFGEIIDVRIPTKPDGKMRGFGFVEFEKTSSAIKAINALNTKELLGRPVAIDFALSKDKYQQLISQKHTVNNSFSLEEEKIFLEEENSNNHESKKSDHLKRSFKNTEVIEENKDSSENEESSDDERDDEVEEESSDDDRDDEIEESTDDSNESIEENENSVSEEIKQEDESPLKKKKKIEKPQRPSDVHEGKTLFIRNLSFDTTKDDLEKAMSKFGPIKYCLLCIDKLTDYPKGTAFVQFINKNSAENCLKETSDSKNKIVLDGRELNISLALSPEDIKRSKEEKQKKGKDNRNLRLLSEGLIRAGSDAAKGVSKMDLKKRLELEANKKSLLKNLHYFISPVRLCIHNLPLHIDDKKLKEIFLKVVRPQAKVTEAKVMRNLKKLDEKGVALSKGFGFVGFTQHEDALQALRKLNNNPNIFTPHKRPIVEFSIENKQKLNAKKRQKERQLGKIKFFSSNKKELSRNICISKHKKKHVLSKKNKNNRAIKTKSKLKIRK